MTDRPAATLARLDAAVKRLHDAANDPAYSTPRVRRADIFAVVEYIDALRTERDKYQALWYETAKMVREERDRQAQAASVLDDVMATLDWVSATTEGSPKQPFLEIHRRVAEQMRRLNTWRAAREG